MNTEFFMSTEEDNLMLGIKRITRDAGGFDLDHINNYIASNPGDVLGYVSKVALLGNQKKYREAHDFLKEAETKFPENGLLHHIRSTIYEFEGKRGEAINESKKATRLNPYSPEIRLTLGTLLNRAGRYDEAIEVWSDILKIDPKLSVAWNSLAKSEFEKGDYKMALNHINAAMMLSEGSPTYYMFLQNRSQMHLASGDLESALSDDEKILTNNFEIGLKHILTQPETLAKKGKQRMAQAYVRRALDRFPKVKEMFDEVMK